MSFHLDATPLFLLSAAALIPLAWLIGEATEHAAQHTGPGIGGFLNASFGNAPELIIALFAVADGLPNVVRGTIAGSVVSNILLVLGIAMIAGGDGRVDARSLRWQLAAVFGAVVLLLVPSIPRWARRPVAAHALPADAARFASYCSPCTSSSPSATCASTATPNATRPREGAWTLGKALVVLTVATAATALVSEILVHSLDAFGNAVGLHEFFIAAVIVAIVGNAAEHGGAVVIAHRGDTVLATEIAITSSMQVAVFVAPAVALLSWLVGDGLPLSFRVIEVATMAAAAAFAALVVWDGTSRRWEGFLLASVYGGVVVAYFFG